MCCVIAQISARVTIRENSERALTQSFSFFFFLGGGGKNSATAATLISRPRRSFNRAGLQVYYCLIIIRADLMYFHNYIDIVRKSTDANNYCPLSTPSSTQ